MELRDQGVICFGEAGEIVSIRKIDFVGTIERGDLCADAAVHAERIGGHRETASDGTRGLTTADLNAEEILRTVIFGDEVDRAAIRGEARAADATVKRQRQDFFLAASRRCDGQVSGGVVDGLDVGLADEGDPLSVG